MIVIIGRDDRTLLGAQHQDSSVYFPDMMSGLDYVRQNDRTISAVIYAYSKDTAHYFFAEILPLRDANYYAFPVDVIFEEKANLTELSRYRFDNSIHAGLIEGSLERKAGAYLHAKKEFDELATLRMGQHYLSERDELTGLVNQRKILEMIEVYIRHCYRESKSVSFVSIKYDSKFDSPEVTLETNYLTDKDRLVLLLSDGIQSSMFRSMDVVGRMDDDHFFIILPETDEAGLDIVTHRINAMLSEESKHHGFDFTVHTSSHAFLDKDRGNVDIQQELVLLLSELSL